MDADFHDEVLRVAALGFERVDRVFADGTVGVEGVSLTVEDGEFMVLVGPSGSGKSTLLRLMAGLDAPTRGRILIDGVDVTDDEPQDRDLAMVFQAYALYPHKTVRENLDFPLRMRAFARERRRRRVEEVAEILDITSLLDRRPGQLSGGQRQRVALGRALVREPKAFLLDEPLSNLDPALRLHARTELARIHRRLGATFLHVTHDQEEAMTLGDRVAVLRQGRVEQVASPMVLYRRPATTFVARFIGSPSMNLYRCRVRRGDRLRLEGPGFRLDIGDGAPDGWGDEVLLGVRPHDVKPVEEGHGRPPDVTGPVELVEPRGSDLLVRLRLEADEDGSPPGEAPTLALILDAGTRVDEGPPLAVHLPRRHLHFFDPEDGSRLEVPRP